MSNLLDYSLAGEGNSLRAQAQQQVPLLANVTLLGQSSVWYAPPNTGKTLIALSLVLQATSDKRIDPAKVFYVNADDSGSGMAEKAVILDDIGAHTLSPGHKGFDLSDLAPALASMTKDGSAKGSFVIIDTLKKVVDLMSKKESSLFAQVARQFSLHGGTILGLAHTNKNRSSSGKLMFAGTSDILDDFDCAYVLDERPSDGKGNDKYIGFEAKKRRGDNDEKACFSYSVEPKLSYQERLLSVEAAEPDFGAEAEVRTLSDDDLIETIRGVISNGTNTKMKIVALTRKATKVSKRAALAVLEKYTGPDLTDHLWDFERKERGAYVYFLHPVPEEADVASE